MDTLQADPLNSTKPANITELEEMNKEADQMLKQKEKELKAYTDAVREAEKILKGLQETVNAKTAELSALSAPDENAENERRLIEEEIERLEASHQKEMQRLQQQHEDEMSSLKADFQQTLNEAENWSNRHAEITLQEKMGELEKLKQEAIEAKQQLNETTFLRSRSTNVNAEAHGTMTQKAVADQIAKLEEQLSELTSVTREELRDSRAKIDECVAAIELRRQSQAAEIKRLEDEIAQRKERYAAHIAAVREQHQLERTTLEQSIAATNARAENTEKIISQLEAHHEAQLAEVLGDIESMRRSMETSGGRSSSNAASVRQAAREIQKLSEEKTGIIEETKMIETEITELDDENAKLREELNRLRARLSKTKM
ncbi:hypothetical protein TRFO_05496 [Tritrichomonas foetus]|uniref:Kinetoplast-associated protein n=1 Tax=Tritrichomonas foetus TaxID=1144522 RepID=A0A1J4K734_9EUKA|nr:hypothetical protein TRFO_05496 [Tritrichomonas foetus]|eukprot:OHT06794.1 hypothetical protein TRFO_05496 [Tritrichomonas foetus]